MIPLEELPPEFDAAGKDAMRAKARDHLLSNAEAFGHMSDEWVAARVRMLFRDNLWHEAICCAARDRIMRLSLRVEALETAAAAADAEFDSALQDSGVPHEVLEVYTSNSWRRVGLKREYREVMAPCLARDGHPDIRGWSVLNAMVAAFNAMLARREKR